MKSKTILLCLFLAILMLTGCTQTAPQETQTGSTSMEATSSESEQVEEPKPFVYDKHTIYPIQLRYENVENQELYGRLYDSIDRCEDSFDLTGYDVDEPDRKAIIDALWNKVNYEFFYIKDIVYNQESNKMEFNYTYPKEELLERKARFAERTEDILSEVNVPGYSDFQKTLACYGIITQNTVYNDSADSIDEVNAYSIIVNGRGICLGYANAMQYLLCASGVNCVSVTSPEPFHRWNLVELDEQWYHLDATFEPAKGLADFLMTDDRRNQTCSFPQSWYLGNQNYETYEAPACDSDRYAWLWDTMGWDYDDEALYFTDSSQGYAVKAMRFRDESVTTVGSIHSEGMALHDGNLIFINLDDERRLYAYDFSESLTQLCEDTWVTDFTIDGSTLTYTRTGDDGEDVQKRLDLVTLVQ